MKWTQEEIDNGIILINENKSFIEISKLLNRGYDSVIKKFRRLGFKSSFEVTTIYNKIDWHKIQKDYNNGFSYSDLIKQFKLTPQAIMWAKNNNKIVFRTRSEGLKIAWKNGKFGVSGKIGVERYRQLCEFKFSIYTYSDKFDISLIEQFGWYKAKNKGDNPYGISRDHMYSVKEGFLNNINPYYISHPANCKLMNQNKNSKKRTQCSITLNELYQRVYEWDKISTSE